MAIAQEKKQQTILRKQETNVYAPLSKPEVLLTHPANLTSSPYWFSIYI